MQCYIVLRVNHVLVHHLDVIGNSRARNTVATRHALGGSRSSIVFALVSITVSIHSVCTRIVSGVRCKCADQKDMGASEICTNPE